MAHSLHPNPDDCFHCPQGDKPCPVTYQPGAWLAQLPAELTPAGQGRPHRSGEIDASIHRAATATRAKEAAAQAAELLLSHRLFRSLSDGEVIDRRWLALHYPPYWHYDVLQALLVLSRLGKAGDPRAGDALELLVRRRRADGRWQPGGSWWRPPGTRSGSGPVEVVDWGRSGPNELLTLNALRVLHAAGWSARSREQRWADRRFPRSLLNVRAKGLLLTAPLRPGGGLLWARRSELIGRHVEHGSILGDAVAVVVAVAVELGPRPVHHLTGHGLADACSEVSPRRRRRCRARRRSDASVRR